MDAKVARVEYEKYADACIEAGICPTCNRPLGIGTDRPTAGVLAICPGCGWTRIKGSRRRASSI